MKYVLLVLSFVFIVAGPARAQSGFEINTASVNPTFEAPAIFTAPLDPSAADDNKFAIVLPDAPSVKSNSAVLALRDSSDPSPQIVQGVFQTYNWQAYVGYTFIWFYQTPGAQVSTNGFNFGIVYYIKDWVGVDGEFVATFGSQYGDTAKFLLGMGGLRFRWSAPRGVELWAHGMVGGSHYLPQTANGNAGALGYELGGGVDFNAHHQRIAYRFEADAVGTQYFNTYQFSPKASAGVVFKF
jgi:hypothetical protein